MRARIDIEVDFEHIQMANIVSILEALPGVEFHGYEQVD